MGACDQIVQVNCQPDNPTGPLGTLDQQCQDGAILGTGDDLRIVLLTRGGGQIIADINPDDSGGFDRRLDGTSELRLVASVGGQLEEACCDALEDAYQWAMEVAVFRDGRDAWVGPITDIKFRWGQVEIFASDLSAWWDRRVSSSQTYVATDLTDIFVGIHDDAMSTDPTPNIVLQTQLTGIQGNRTIDGSLYLYARDHLQELSHTGVDWTAYGRSIIVGGQEIPAAPYVTLLDEHFTEPPQIEQRGNDQATVVIVRGTGVVAIVRDEEYVDFYGEVVRVFNEPDIIDQASADEAAQSRLDYLKDPTFIVTPANASLKSTAPITLPELIPGMRIRVDSQATCRKLVRDFRLERVNVRFNGEVQLQLQPLGTVDVDPVVPQGGAFI